jgi:hypothetical protein
MGKGFKHGAGVVASDDSILNFTVRAYQSDVELNTATPDENTIGVVTTNPITEWYFSTTKPENVAEGAVWFKVGDASRSAFNALKQKTIMVYPLRAEQYISGAWSVKTAKIYQNEAWTDWMIWLYKNGDEYTDITGGWVAGETNGKNTVKKEGSYIELSGSSDTTARMHISTSKKVDFTQYKTLNAKVTVTSRSTTNPLVLRLGYGSAKTDSLAASAITRTELTTDAVGDYTLSYDVSAVSGEQFPIFGIGWHGVARVTEIWFE